MSQKLNVEVIQRARQQCLSDLELKRQDERSIAEQLRGVQYWIREHISAIAMYDRFLAWVAQQEAAEVRAFEMKPGQTSNAGPLLIDGQAVPHITETGEGD